MTAHQVGKTVAEYKENALANPKEFLDNWMREIASKQLIKPNPELAQKVIDQFVDSLRHQKRGNKRLRRLNGWKLYCSQQALQKSVLKGQIVMSFDPAPGKDTVIILTPTPITVDMTITEMYPRHDVGDQS